MSAPLSGRERPKEIPVEEEKPQEQEQETTKEEEKKELD